MTKIEEIEQELFETERKLKSMFNSCSQDLAIGIEKLRGELAELKESKKEGKWKPEINEQYWIKTDEGEFDWFRWYGDNEDNWRYKNLSLFPTKEGCERYWHFMDTVKEKSYEFSREEWENTDIKKYCIAYNNMGKEFYTNRASHVKEFGMLYFKTHDDAQYIIDNFKDELMEYWI